MSEALVLLWLGTAQAKQAAKPHLQSYQSARGVALAPPTPSVSHQVTYSAQLVQSLEAELERARLAQAAADRAAALELLDSVDQRLLAHPELPQAAWLLAEGLSLRAALAEQAGHGEQAARLRARAAELEGSRVRTFAATTAPDLPTKSQPPRQLLGLQDGDQVYVNGRRTGAPRIGAGKHHVRVLRRGRVLLSRWLDVPHAGSIQVPLPPAQACSREDLAGIEQRATGPRAPARTRCESWVVARPVVSGIELASCHQGWCSDWITWRARPSSLFDGPPQPRRHERASLWPYVGAGVAVVMLTTVIIWRSGVLSEREPGRTRFEYDGPEGAPAALRF